MNTLTTLLAATVLTLSANAFAGAPINHESLYDPAYLAELTDGRSAGGAGLRSDADLPVHETLYDPAYLRALGNTTGSRSPAGMVISHESLFDIHYLRALDARAHTRG
ncbi:hypothetical protein [Methyloversatilis sp.]|uniref:hypothetical protein n=1 Tax=Methyloversatilis sp. TaxID=2569862 RepID=UPI0035B332BB